MNTLGQDLAHLYGRELDRLADEIAAYGSEADVWSTRGEQKNSPGTLALHVVGGLMHYIGATLGDSGYVRDRDREFRERDVPRDHIVRRIQECRDVCVPVLEGLDEVVLHGPWSGELPPQLGDLTTRGFLIHLLWHLGWHTGQVYYHRLGVAGPGRV